MIKLDLYQEVTNTIVEALENIKEVIEMCLEETRNFFRYTQEIYMVI